MTPARDEILKRLRRGARAPRLERPPAMASGVGWGEPCGSDVERFAERFRRFLTVGGEVYGSFQAVESVERAAEAVAETLRTRDVTRLTVHPSRLCREVLDRAVGKGLRLTCDAQPAEADAALCEADWLCVETGSYAVRSREGWARSASLLPPEQMVLARESSLVDSLATLFANVSASEASCAAVISGPSRTADVEKTLVVPAHGPQALHLILILGL